MKRLILFFLLTGLALTNLPSQTLHAILVANTKSVMPEFAEICKADLLHFRQEAQEMANGAGYAPELYELSGDDFTSAKLQALVASVQPKEGDAILFYFSGAAFCDSTDPGRDCNRYLRLGKDSKDLLYTDRLFDTLEGKKARLKIFIVDGCSLLRSPPGIGRDRGVAPPQRVYQSLFSACGTLRIFSSQCSEYSYGDGRGSLFTNAFLAAIDHFIKTNSPSLTWRQLLAEAGKTTVSQALAILCKPQHPWVCWEGLREGCVP